MPVASDGELLIAVEACAVCRTDLHVADGELPDIPYPVIPGHQIVGRVAGFGPSRSSDALPALGSRIGVPWLGYTCGACRYCAAGLENLCDGAAFTGYTLPGGFAEYLTADARFCFALDEGASAEQIAPLMCAGMIGYRALQMCGSAERIGLFGFGAAAHVLAQLIRHQRREFYAFTRPGDAAAQRSAEALGARWSGASHESPGVLLDAAIIFAPIGALVPAALASVAKAGTVVCAGIHMSDIPSFRYSLLWGERSLRSVANLTRRDGAEFLALAQRIPVRTQVRLYALEQAEEALEDLRHGAFTGSAVLRVGAR